MSDFTGSQLNISDDFRFSLQTLQAQGEYINAGLFHGELLCNAQQQIIWCSPVFESICGYTKENFKDITDLLLIPNSKDKEKLRDFLLDKSEAIQHMVFKALKPSGLEWHGLLYSVPVYITNGACSGKYYTLTDVDYREIASYRALVASQEKYKLLADNSTDVIALVDLNFICTYMSPSVNRVFGYTADEVMGKCISCFMPPDAFKKVLDSYKMRQELEVVNPGKTPPIYVEIEIIDKYEQRVWGEVISTPIYNANKQLNSFLLSIRDITERKKTLSEIKKLSQSVQQSPAMVCITDVNGLIEYVNPKFSEVTGYSLKEVAGKKTNILKSGLMSIEVYKRLWETISAGHRWEGDLRNRKKNGELFWERCSISPFLDDYGKIVKYIAIKEDISEKKEHERRIYHTILETEKRERERFAKELHDGLGAHLSAINVYLNMILDEGTNKEELVEMLQTVRSIVDEAKKSAREIANNIRPETLTKKGLVVYFREFFGNINRTGNLKIVFSSNPEELSLPLDIEENLFRIISELFNNSLKHSMASVIEIKIELRNNILEMNYSDNGKGFDLFQKLKERRDGMGLINIYKRAESLGGKCEMHSEPGYGLQTKITLFLT